ncbi:MAG: hypothetical protein A3F11_06950 [Gammaproteobacteria bacterium RIFCSPHIGHO2_12_FULL_37_14]|nr:MAG: hypothetical protein A3F11_06950 [Gammaproteobacteria bacterium RIFCSPHIGHO2_12_FULL_37_14]
MTKALFKCYLLFIALFFSSVNFASPIPFGKYYHINNASIYAVSYGKGPTVVFESGLGNGVNVWSKVAPFIAKHATVVLYDRAGTEKSKFLKNTTQAQTAQIVVSNLKELLQKMHLNPPYILVGHSVGGLYVQLFAREYPKEVSGVVLVDSMSPNQNLNDPLPSKRAYYYLDALGIPASENEVKKAPVFPNTPLIVLSATIHGKLSSIYNSKANKIQWAKWQAELAAMSNKSQYITANKTDHYIQKEKSWLVISAINEILDVNNS